MADKVKIDPSTSIPPVEGEEIKGVLMETEEFQPHTGDYEELDRISGIAAGLDNIETELHALHTVLTNGLDWQPTYDELTETAMGLKEVIDQFEQTSLFAVLKERARQNDKWGGPAHDDEHVLEEWIDYIHSRVNVLRLVALTQGDQGESFGEADLMGDITLRLNATPDKTRKLLVQVAALALAAIESHDRLQKGAPDAEIPPE